MSDFEAAIADSSNKQRRKTWLWLFVLVVATVFAAWWTLLRSADQPFPDPAYVENVPAGEFRLGAGHLDDGRSWELRGAAIQNRRRNTPSIYDDRFWAASASTNLTTNDVVLVFVNESEPIELQYDDGESAPVFGTSYEGMFRREGNGLVATVNGHVWVISDTGGTRQFVLQRPSSRVADNLEICDANLSDDQLTFLVRGRLNGHQAGSKVTYSIPTIDFGSSMTGEEDKPAPHVLEPTEDAKTKPFIDAVFQPGSTDWASLHRTPNDAIGREVQFSWGRTLDVPSTANRVWFLDSNTLVVQARSKDGTRFYTVAMNTNPLQLQERFAMGSKYWELTHAVSPDRRWLILRTSFFRSTQFFGRPWSSARDEFQLISLPDWTPVANASETNSGWVLNPSTPYRTFSFLPDSQLIRLLRSSNQIEVYSLNDWIDSMSLW